MNVDKRFLEKYAAKERALLALLEAARKAQAVMDMRSMTRRKWTMDDQRSYEVLSAAIKQAEEAL